MKEKSKTIWYGILTVYSLGVLIFGTYFEWLYAKENGFISWLFFGWLVPMLKAIIWPIYFLLYM